MLIRRLVQLFSDCPALPFWPHIFCTQVGVLTSPADLFYSWQSVWLKFSLKKIASLVAGECVNLYFLNKPASVLSALPATREGWDNERLPSGPVRGSLKSPPWRPPQTRGGWGSCTASRSLSIHASTFGKSLAARCPLGVLSTFCIGAFKIRWWIRVRLIIKK